MDYQRHYNLLIDRSRNRVLTGYIENHHVIPKCLSRTDVQENIVSLTPEEHFLAHQLLVKIYPGNYKLVLAVRMMCISNKTQKRINKIYGWIKRKVDSERIITVETRTKMSLSAKNQSAEKKEVISKKLKGRTSPNKGSKYTAEQKEKMKNRVCNTANLGKKFSEETKLKMSIAKKGIPKSDEHKAKMKIAQQKRWSKE